MCHVGKSCRGFTLIEMLVVIAILLPALRTVKETTRRMVCSTHVNQVVMALHIYGGENNHRLPGADWRSPSWMRNGGSLLSMLGSISVGLDLFKCPSFSGDYLIPYTGYPYPSPIVMPHDDGGARAYTNDIIRMQYTYIGGRGDCDRRDRGCLYPEDNGAPDMWKGWSCGGNCPVLQDPDNAGPVVTLDYRSYPAAAAIFTDHMWVWRGNSGPWGTPIHNANWDHIGGNVIPNHTSVSRHKVTHAYRFNWTEGGNVGFIDGHTAWRSGKAIASRRPQAWGHYEPFVCY